MQSCCFFILMMIALVDVLAPDRAAELATAAWQVSSEGADVKQRVLDVICQMLDPRA